MLLGGIDIGMGKADYSDSVTAYEGYIDKF